MLTVGSLFAGIGGFDLGLERTGGFKTKWQVEIDPYCQWVLEKHWPDVKRYGDIRTVTDIERVDVLCGGFPCQDISNAGKRAGIDGERSGLWSEYVRLIRELRPRYILVENVAALLGRGMGRVLRDLSESWYDAEWGIIRASDMGAPHQRERLWLVAYTRSESQYRPIFPEDCPQLGRTKTIGSEYWEFFTLVPGVPTGFGRWREMGQPGLVRIDDGIPDVLDRLRGIGNAIVPQIAEWIGNRILDYERNQ